MCHTGKSVTIRESNHAPGVYKELYTKYYVPKSSILLAGTGVWKICSVPCGSSPVKIDYSDYLKSLISRINEVNVFSIKYRCSDILLKKNNKNFIYNSLFCWDHTCNCVNMVSMMSVSRYITSASRYHLRYQSRSSMYICGLIPQNLAELAEAVLIWEWVR